MVDKVELKKKIDEIKAQIKANSKDAHFADTLTNELLSLKGQLDVEPLELNVGKRIDDFSGNAFEIVKTDRGIMYHEFGGYTIFTAPTNEALYVMLADYVDNKDEYKKLDGEEKEIFDLNLSVIKHCLTVPKYAFVDVDFTYDISEKIINFLKSSFEKAINADLQEETIAEDEQFKQATLALEDIKEQIKKEQEGA